MPKFPIAAGHDFGVPSRLKEYNCNNPHLAAASFEPERPSEVEEALLTDARVYGRVLKLIIEGLTVHRLRLEGHFTSFFSDCEVVVEERKAGADAREERGGRLAQLADGQDAAKPELVRERQEAESARRVGDEGRREQRRRVRRRQQRGGRSRGRLNSRWWAPPP